MGSESSYINRLVSEDGLSLKVVLIHVVLQDLLFQRSKLVRPGKVPSVQCTKSLWVL
jgi:hypothetical protein